MNDKSCDLFNKRYVYEYLFPGTYLQNLVVAVCIGLLAYTCNTIDHNVRFELSTSRMGCCAKYAQANLLNAAGYNMSPSRNILAHQY